MLNRLLLISREVCLNLVLVNIRLLDYYQGREEGEEIQLEINSNINIRLLDHYLRREHALIFSIPFITIDNIFLPKGFTPKKTIQMSIEYDIILTLLTF